jgi:hypothetical protein
MFENGSKSQFKDAVDSGTRASKPIKKQDLLNKSSKIPATFITESLINSSSANNSNSEVA